MTRLRSPAQRAPQSKEQAIPLLERYAQLSADLGHIEANRTSALAATNAVADALAVPVIAELKDIVKQLKPWWAASIEELTQGKRKSMTLGGCTIGYRISPPKVTHTHGKDDAAVLVLRGTGYEGELIRVSYALDKPAILKALEAQAADEGAQAAGEQGASLADLGFGSKQTEEFFVEPLTDAASTEGAGSEAADVVVGKGIGAA